MTSFLAEPLLQQNFIPHGFCLLWQPELLWLHVVSDSMIAIAYYTIPFALIYFISKRRDLAFRGIFALTGTFILACGTTHVMAVLTLWDPAYWLDGMVKFFTALISIGTAAAMWRVMPKALALPSMAQLEQANRRLEHEIGERERAEAALREANAELERRVAARTAELEGEVAQRRRTEETLRASEQRWRSMFEASAVGIALTDENQRFVAANEAFQKMIGYTGEELSTLGPVEITYEEDREATREMLDQILSGGRSDYHVEKRYRRKDGTVIWVRVSTARAPESGSNFRGVPTIIENITERKRAEDALQEARDELLRVSRLSTMGELSTSIAHEVNQPLTAIVANGSAEPRSRRGQSRGPRDHQRRQTRERGAGTHPPACQKILAGKDIGRHQHRHLGGVVDHPARAATKPSLDTNRTGSEPAADFRRSDSDAASRAQSHHEWHRGDARRDRSGARIENQIRGGNPRRCCHYCRGHGYWL